MQSKWLKSTVIPTLIISVLIILTFVLFGSIEDYFISLLEEVQEQKLIFSILSFLILLSDILLPVPSSIIMFINGFVLGVVGGGLLSLFALMGASVVGYFLGKFSQNIFHSKANISASSMVESYGMIAIIVTRGMPVLAEAVSIVCGYNRMNFRKYLLFSFIGYLPLCFLYSFFGQLGQDKNLFLITFFISLLIAAVMWFIARKFFLKKSGE